MAQEHNLGEDAPAVSILRRIGKQMPSDGPSRFIAVYLGAGVIIAFLFLASLAPQIGEKLGTLSVKKQTQKSEAATPSKPRPTTVNAIQGSCPLSTDPSKYYGDIVAPFGRIDNNDSQSILRIVAGLPNDQVTPQRAYNETEKQLADVDGKGGVTSADALHVLKLISSNTPLPRCI